MIYCPAIAAPSRDFVFRAWRRHAGCRPRSLCPILWFTALTLLLAGCGADSARDDVTSEGFDAPDQAGDSTVRQIQIDDGYLYRPVPGTNASTGYFEITNHSPEPVTLTGADSDVAERVEMHTHIHEDDMMRMRALPELSLPTGEPVAFAPGGHHLMLFGVDDMPGRSADVTLFFDNGLELTVPFSIRSR